MTLRYLLDTSTLSLTQGPIPDRLVVDRVDALGTQSAISSVALHELLFGIATMPFGRRRRDLERFAELSVRRIYPVLPYDEEAAAWHATERARLRQIGLTPPFRDGQIAATAFVNGLTVVTANVRDFQNFQGLPIEDWSTPRA